MTRGEIIEPVVTIFTEEENLIEIDSVHDSFWYLENDFNMCNAADFLVITNEVFESSGIQRVRREIHLGPEQSAALWRFFSELGNDDPIPEVLANGAFLHISSSTGAHDHFLGFGGLDEEGSRLNLFELHQPDRTRAEAHSYPRDDIELPEDLLNFAGGLVDFMRQPDEQMRRMEKANEMAEYVNIQKLLRDLDDNCFYVDPESGFEIGYYQDGFHIKSPHKGDPAPAWALISDTELPATIQNGFSLEVDFSRRQRPHEGEIRLQSARGLLVIGRITHFGDFGYKDLNPELEEQLEARGLTIEDLLSSASRGIKDLLPQAKTNGEIRDGWAQSEAAFIDYILSASDESQTDLVTVYTPHERAVISFEEAEFNHKTRQARNLPLFAVARLGDMGQIADSYLAVPGPVSEGWQRIGLCRINDDETYEKYQGGVPFGKAYDKRNLVIVRIGEYDPEPNNLKEEEIND